MHFLLFSNVMKDPEQEITGRLEEMILSRGQHFSKVLEGDRDSETVIEESLLKQLDYVIVLGGDGTMLRASHAIGEHPIPMIGLNLGTTGFLTEVECSAMENMVERLIRGDYIIEERMQLEGIIRRKDPSQPEERFTALNDVVVIREGVLRLIALKIYVNNIFFDTYEADGVILSTPTGSTGYNLSAGGPLVSPRTSLMVLTPISPHSLSKKSVVFGAGDRIRIALEEKRKTQVNEAIVSFDGFKNYEMSVGDEVEVVAAQTPLRLVRFENRSFYQVISRKLSQN
ncbi:MAG: NAD(+)/NADH kinase [Eubacterium sp.]|nr:NAD(+)/NADH kinase [Eubacterium sp.]